MIIEDERMKIEKLTQFFSWADLSIHESFHSAIRELKENHTLYDLLILDMTLPLWEQGNNDLGGNFELFGGEKILKEMKRKKLGVKTILFTMFDVFPTKDGNIGFKEVDAVFRKNFGEFYVGGVLYASDDDSWKLRLQELVNQTLQK